MKRYIYIRCLMISLSLVVMASLSSCDNSSDNDDNAQIPIRFESDANPFSSKGGIVTNETDLRNVSAGFSVSGAIKLPQTDNSYSYSPVMKNRKVYYDAVAEKWTYAPEIYWTRGYDYYFLAYAPRINVTESEDEPYVTVMPEQGYLEIWKFPQYQDAYSSENSAKSLDLMTAGVSCNYASSDHGKVLFVLKHELALLEIRAYKLSTQIMMGRTYTVKSITVGSNNYKMAENENRKCLLNITNEQFTTWYKPGEGNNYEPGFNQIDGGTYQIVDGYEGDAPVVDVKDADGNDRVIARCLIAPFELGTVLPVSLVYEYEDNTTHETCTGLTISGAISLDSGNKFFMANKKYIITLQFAIGTSLEGEVAVVENWASGGSYTPPVYNW